MSDLLGTTGQPILQFAAKRSFKSHGGARTGTARQRSRIPAGRSGAARAPKQCRDKGRNRDFEPQRDDPRVHRAQVVDEPHTRPAVCSSDYESEKDARRGSRQMLFGQKLGRLHAEEDQVIPRQYPPKNRPWAWCSRSGMDGVLDHSAIECCRKSALWSWQSSGSAVSQDWRSYVGWRPAELISSL
jgi:hypothetical protein